LTAGYSHDVDRQLTPRMRDALTGVAGGETARQTAVRLGVCEPTVRTILAAARDRLGADSSAAAVATALRRGLL
jgi:DNA-binding NarL/FixJ family response regulator